MRYSHRRIPPALTKYSNQVEIWSYKENINWHLIRFAIICRESALQSSSCSCSFIMLGTPRRIFKNVQMGCSPENQYALYWVMFVWEAVLCNGFVYTSKIVTTWGRQQTRNWTFSLTMHLFSDCVLLAWIAKIALSQTPHESIENAKLIWPCNKKTCSLPKTAFPSKLHFVNGDKLVWDCSQCLRTSRERAKRTHPFQINSENHQVS